MLAMCERWLRLRPDTPYEGVSLNKIVFMKGNWLALPPSVRGLDLVAGDNAFSFLQYPQGWDEMLDVLSDRMTEGSVLFARLLSVPANDRRLSPLEIVKNT